MGLYYRYLPSRQTSQQKYNSFPDSVGYVYVYLSRQCVRNLQDSMDKRFRNDPPCRYATLDAVSYFPFMFAHVFKKVLRSVFFAPFIIVVLSLSYVRHTLSYFSSISKISLYGPISPFISRFCSICSIFIEFTSATSVIRTLRVYTPKTLQPIKFIFFLQLQRGHFHCFQ